MTRVGIAAAAGYVAVVAALVIAAEVGEDSRFYLIAGLLTLPAGLAAIIGVYVAYGLASQIVDGLSSGLSSDQLDHRTMLATAPINVLLFAAAAVGNVALIRRALRSRSARQTAP